MRAGNARVAISLAVAIAGCGKSAPVAPSNEGGIVREPQVTTCETLEACRPHDGQVVRVVGVYGKYPFGKGKGRRWRGHIRIDLGDGVLLLGRYWHDESRRDEAEIERFDGERVAVTGRFLAVTPPKPGDPPYAQHLSIPAMVEIDGIEPSP